jgi:transcriptional regulator with GAF, ATPase, and Fis domain
MRRNSQVSEAKIARLELIRRIEQLTGVENRLDVILSNALHYMHDVFNPGPGIVCKCSSDCGVVRVVSVSSDFHGDAKEIEQTVASRVRARQAAGKTVDPVRFLADCLAQEHGRPAVTVPMEVAGHVIGMFAFWSRDREEPDSDVRLILQLAADIIARKVAIDSLNLRIQSQEEQTSWQEQTRVSVEKALDTRLKFAALSKAMSERFTVQSVSLTFVHVGERMSRFTWTEGRVLIEYQLPRLSHESLVAIALEHGQPVVYRNLSEVPESWREELLIAPSACSLAVFPIRIAENINAVLTLSYDREDALDRRSIAEINGLSPLMMALVLPDLLKEARRREGSRLEKLSHALKATDFGESKQTILSTLASLVLEEYDADILRLSLTDESGMFLESQVLVTADSRRCSVPADGRIILSLAPVHQRVLMTCESTTISQHDGAGSLLDFEMSQTLAEDVSQVAIVPLIAKGRSIGVMTMGTVHNRLAGVDEPGGLALAEIVAAIASEYLTFDMRRAENALREPVRWNRLRQPASVGGKRSPEQRRVHADIFS